MSLPPPPSGFATGIIILAIAAAIGLIAAHFSSPGTNCDPCPDDPPPTPGGMSWDDFEHRMLESMRQEQEQIEVEHAETLRRYERAWAEANKRDLRKSIRLIKPARQVIS